MAVKQINLLSQLFKARRVGYKARRVGYNSIVVDHRKRNKTLI